MVDVDRKEIKLRTDALGARINESVTESSLSANIPDAKRQDLPRILKQLGLTQKDIAVELDVSPGAISKYLAIGSGHARLRPERVQKLVSFLKERLAGRKSLGSSQDEHIPGADRPRSTDPILSPEAMRSLEAELDGLLAGEEEVVGPELGPVFAAPGGAMPVSAANYVDRLPDMEIEDILTAGRSPASIVVAPVNGGSSSFLNRVYRQARLNPENWVKIVHMDAAFVHGETISHVDLFKYLFRKIGVPGNAFADNDVEDMKDAFDRWVQDEWKGCARAVLIIDGLDQVFKDAPIHSALTLVNWLGALRNEAALGEPPYNKLILFTAFTGRTWSAAHASPYATQAGELRLKKFTRQEAVLLFEQLEITSLSAEEIDSVYELFNGHPFLTQLFAWSIRDGVDYDEARRKALTLQDSYETHWERMKAEIQFLIPADHTTYEVLAAVMRFVDGTYDQHPKEEVRRLWNTYSRDLRVFGLVDADATSKPKICEFYKVAINSEERRISDPSFREDLELAAAAKGD